jgi:hypothetical protein
MGNDNAYQMVCSGFDETSKDGKQFIAQILNIFSQRVEKDLTRMEILEEMESEKEDKGAEQTSDSS